MLSHKNQRFLLSISSGILLTLSFPYAGSLTPIIFVALCPFLVLYFQLSKEKNQFLNILIHSFLCFLIYNFGTTWWIWNSTEIGSIMAFVFNSIIMCSVFILHYLISKKSNAAFFKFGIIPFWIAYEFLHHRWELSWPWLSFGNIFSNTTDWIQWYEYTGILAGTFWILFVNVLITHSIIENGFRNFFQIRNKQFWMVIGLIITPILLSYIILNSYSPASNEKYRIVVVQPNIDPYNEKFSKDYTPVEQLKKFFSLIEPYKTDSIDLVLGPETMLSSEIWEERIEQFPVIKYLNQQKRTWKNTEFLVGASTSNLFESKNSSASKKLPKNGGYIESYNTSLFFSNELNKELIHKSKLVLGVEKIPFSSWLPFLENFALENGGSSGSLGTESEPKIIQTKSPKIAPVICYESIYGEFIGEQVKKGANVICILTNDAWWGDSPGYKQHFSFAKLRAIENRRWVARSANTGTSGFISPTGKVMSASNYWVTDVLVQDVDLNNDVTFYAKHGDYLGRASLVISLIFITLFITNTLGITNLPRLKD